MSKLSFVMIALVICLAAVPFVGAQDAIRVKCDRYTMNVPSLNAGCFQIDENIPAAAEAGPAEIAAAQIACTSIHFSDYDGMMSAIAPEVTFYRVDDLGRASFTLLDIGLRISDVMNNINAGYTGVENVTGELPFLPYQAAERTVNALPVKLDFQNGSGVRTVTAFQDQLSAAYGNSNLYYSFQGITSDGITYVSAVFPLECAALNGRTAADVDWNSVASSDFRPALDELDFYIRSIVIE